LKNTALDNYVSSSQLEHLKKMEFPSHVTVMNDYNMTRDIERLYNDDEIMSHGLKGTL